MYEFCYCNEVVNNYYLYYLYTCICFVLWGRPPHPPTEFSAITSSNPEHVILSRYWIVVGGDPPHPTPPTDVKNLIFFPNIIIKCWNFNNRPANRFESFHQIFNKSTGRRQLLKVFDILYIDFNISPVEIDLLKIFNNWCRPINLLKTFETIRRPIVAISTLKPL